MFEDIKPFLVNHIGELPTSQVINIIEVLDSLNYEDHTFPLKCAVDDIENNDATDSVNLIRSIAYDNAVLALKEFGIKLIDDLIPYDVLYSFLFTVKTLENYEDKQHLLNIIENGETSSLTFVELVNLITNLDWNNTLQYVKDVDVALIDRIKDVTLSQIKPLFEPPANNDKYIARAKLYFKQHGISFIRDLIRDGFRIGNKKEIYIKELENKFSTYDPLPEEYANEILSIAVISDVEDDAVITTAKELSEMIVTDTNQLIRVNLLIDKYFKEVYDVKR